MNCMQPDPTQSRPLRLTLQLAALSTVALGSAALAADVTLNNNDAAGTSSFTTAGQWNNAAPPSAGNNYFNGGFTLRTPTTAGSFSFGGDALTINAGAAGRLLGKGAGTGTTQTITVANLILNGGRLEQAGGENTNNIVFVVNGNINVTAASFLGALGANANGSTNFEIMEIGATISGSEPLVVAGSANGGANRGVVRLSAANAYSGQIDVLQPTNGNTISSTTNRLLQLNHLDALRFATLGLSTTAQNPISFTAAANTGTFRVGAITGSAAQTLTDTAGNPVTLEIGGSGLESFYSGALRGSGNVVKAGEGTVIIQGQAQTYTGSTTILDGVLSLGTGSLLHNDSTVSIADGAALDLFHEETDVVAGLTLGGVPQPDGIYDSSTPGGYITGPGKIQVNTGAPVPENVSLIANDAVGTSSFNVAGNWSNLAAPSAINNYFTQAFTLRTPNSAGSFTFAGGSLTVNAGGRIIGKGAGTADAQQTIVVNNLILNGGLLDQASADVPGAVLTVQGNVTVAAESFIGALGSPTNNTGFETLNIEAPISGSANLRVAGTANASADRGVVRLSAANPYTGTISVEQPTTITSLVNRLLQLNHLDALQNATLSLLTTTENGMSFASAVNTGSFRIAGLTGTASQTLTDTAGASVTVNIGGTNGSSSFDGVLTGSGSLVKSGSGTLSLNGANSYTGSTTVSAGTLVVSQASLDDASTVSVAGSAFLDLPHGATDVVGSLVLNGIPQEEGTYNSSNSGGRITGSGSIQVGGSTGGFSSFMDQFSGLSAADKEADADPDQDGLSNLVEYALDGFDPTAANTLPGLANNVLSFTKRALAVSNGDVTYAIEASATLGVEPQPWAAVTPDVNDATTLSYTLPTGPVKNFVRLSVTAAQ
jgi:fibronectin-binding autotransporter adhesin